jgi:hypothetical protein
MTINEAIQRLTGIRDQGHGERAMHPEAADLLMRHGVPPENHGEPPPESANGGPPRDGGNGGAKKGCTPLWQLAETKVQGVQGAVILRNGGQPGVMFPGNSVYGGEEGRCEFTSVASDVAVLVNCCLPRRLALDILNQLLRSVYHESGIVRDELGVARDEIPF